MEKTKLEISEAGNGWPNINDLVWDTSTGILYQIVDDNGGYIMTSNPGAANTCIMFGKEIGNISDVEDEHLLEHGCGARVLEN